MGPIVSDSGPVHYLILIGAIDILPKLFGRVLIPEIVAFELTRPATPAIVRDWIIAAPPWLERRALPNQVLSAGRDAGEQAAIELAGIVGARILLIDDRAGDRAARAAGLETTGTLGVLIRAAQLNHVELKTAFERLRATNFRCPPEMLDTLLARYGSVTGVEASSQSTPTRRPRGKPPKPDAP